MLTVAAVVGRSCVVWSWPSWLGRRRPALSHLHIVLYARVGCHPCADAKTLLADRQARDGFRLEVRDIDAEPEMKARYGDCVPVVLVNDRVRFRGRVDRRLLDRLLEGERGGTVDQ
jgi:glutaredoxin